MIAIKEYLKTFIFILNKQIEDFLIIKLKLQIKIASLTE